MDRREAEKRAQRLLEMVGLSGFEHHYPGELSVGMQQRANLARAIAVDPEVLLMDEPFAALDAQTRELMQSELLGIWAQTKKTVVFITHQIDEAIYLSDRVIVMSARPGRIIDECHRRAGPASTPRNQAEPGIRGARRADLGPAVYGGQAQRRVRARNSAIGYITVTESARPLSLPNVPRHSWRRTLLGSERARYGIAGVVVILAIWEAVSRTETVKSVLISSPSAVAAAAIDEFATGAIWPNLEATLSVWVIGFAIASTLGIAIGLLSGRFRRFRYVADSWLNATNVAPDLAFVPILILWFGIGVTFKIVLVVLTGTFYVAVNTLAGAQERGRALPSGWPQLSAHPKPDCCGR